MRVAGKVQDGAKYNDMHIKSQQQESSSVSRSISV